MTENDKYGVELVIVLLSAPLDIVTKPNQIILEVFFEKQKIPLLETLLESAAVSFLQANKLVLKWATNTPNTIDMKY